MREPKGRPEFSELREARFTKHILRSTPEQPLNWLQGTNSERLCNLPAYSAGLPGFGCIGCYPDTGPDTGHYPHRYRHRYSLPVPLPGHHFTTSLLQWPPLLWPPSLVNRTWY